MSKLIEGYLKNIGKVKVNLQEGFFRAEKSVFWIEEVISLAENLNKIIDIANKYIKDVEKSHPEDVGSIALEVAIKVDPTIKSVVSKEKRGKSFMTIILRDGNDIMERMNEGVITVLKVEVKLGI
jgi:hypothetical protein